MLPFVPLLIVLLVQMVPHQALPGRTPGLPAVVIVIFGYFSVTATHDYLEWNRLRWTATTALMADGKITSRQVDGGYEFNGLLSYDPNYKSQDGKSWWWVHDDTYMIGSGPVPGYAELNRYDFRRWFIRGTSSVVVLKTMGNPIAAPTNAASKTVSMFQMAPLTSGGIPTAPCTPAVQTGVFARHT